MAHTVLYIDDRPTLLELRKATLESHGLSVETVLSESAAMRMLEGTSVDAVLFEYKQEGLDGEAIAYHIHQRFPNLPIILISAYFEIPERILWLVDEYVLKSEMPEGIVRAIERVACEGNADKAHQLAPRSNEPVPLVNASSVAISFREGAQSTVSRNSVPSDFYAASISLFSKFCQ